MKQRLEIRIEKELRDGIDVVVARSGQAVTTVVERYIREGLARDNGELMEESTLPLISKTVRHEVDQAFDQLYEKLRADLQKSARRSDDRLAALIVKAARNAGIGQRMIQELLARVGDRNWASRVYDQAKELTGKEIARPEE
jgi:GNAT superfamily N-acetyltransferase